MAISGNAVIQLIDANFLLDNYIYRNGRIDDNIVFKHNTGSFILDSRLLSNTLILLKGLGFGQLLLKT